MHEIDRRAKDGTAPFEVVEGPLPEFEGDAVEGPILKGRYKALSAFGASSKGGVYKCLDLKTNREVVVKEARMPANCGWRSRCDAADGLKNEYHVLQRLKDTGVAPQPLDFFQEW